MLRADGGLRVASQAAHTTPSPQHLSKDPHYTLPVSLGCGTCSALFLHPAVSGTLTPIERVGREDGEEQVLAPGAAAGGKCPLSDLRVKSGKAFGDTAHSQCLGTGNHQQPPAG